MSQKPEPAEIAKWDRWFAIECNNRAWDLAEKETRTAEETSEMIDAAHSASLHWGRVGTELNKVRAAMLLGHVHALAGHGVQAMHYARISHAYFNDAANPNACPDWELAFAHAILANAAHAFGDADLYAEMYASANRLGQVIADPQDRAIFQKTFFRIPAPAPEVVTA
ncbi:MAG: hypothetical protein ACAI35_03065 [Candidatus Methylacidiphilales bacterium]|nr:hypothetical protein [Candidatus Methylacidiphilales bacterium]